MTENRPNVEELSDLPGPCDFCWGSYIAPGEGKEPAITSINAWDEDGNERETLIESVLKEEGRFVRACADDNDGCGCGYITIWIDELESDSDFDADSLAATEIKFEAHYCPWCGRDLQA